MSGVDRLPAARLARRTRLLISTIAAALWLGPGVAAQDWRPLALSSFDVAWQTINDKFYDPAFNGVDWKAVRNELRPKAEAASSADDVRRVIKDMIGRLKESHFVLMPSGGAIRESMTIQPAAVSIEVRIVDAKGDSRQQGTTLIISRVVAESTAEKAGFRPGQVITAIDGKQIASFIAASTSVAVSDRNLDAYRASVRALHGALGSLATIEVRDGDAAKSLQAARVIEDGQVVQVGNLPPEIVRVGHRLAETPAGKHVGVIDFNIWLAQIDKPIAAAVDEYRHADGLVLDLRGNPGGLAAMIQGLAGHFMNDDTAVLGVMKMRGTTLTFHPNPRRSTPDGRTVEPFAGPVAVLVDQMSASASECFAAGVQSLGRVRVFGRQTMGAALPANTTTLPDGDVLMYVVGDFVTSKGQRVEGKGVVPDEVVALTPAAFGKSPDPDMAAALAWIDRGGRK